MVTDWLAENQYEIETWKSDTRYNFDICLEAGRIRTGLEEVRRFLDINHMGYELNPELTEERKARLREKLPRNLVIRDDFEWNCYYNIFKKGLK